VEAQAQSVQVREGLLGQLPGRLLSNSLEDAVSQIVEQHAARSGQGRTAADKAMATDGRIGEPAGSVMPVRRAAECLGRTMVVSGDRTASTITNGRQPRRHLQRRASLAGHRNGKNAQQHLKGRLLRGLVGT
jgi:hypothetical protein